MTKVAGLAGLQLHWGRTMPTELGQRISVHEATKVLSLHPYANLHVAFSFHQTVLKILQLLHFAQEQANTHNSNQ